MNKIRILHLLNSRIFSGAENVVCQIIEMFKSNDTLSMAYCSPDGAIREAVESRGIVYFPLAKLNRQNLKKVIEKYQPQIIHAHDVKAGCYAALFAKRNIRIISHIHACFEDMKRLSIKSICYLLVSKRFFEIFWVSKSSLNGFYFFNLVKKKSCILYNVIDKTEILRKISESSERYDFDIIYLGRITYQKNPERLIKVIQYTKEKLERKGDELLHAVIVGNGELQEKIEKLVKENNLEKNVTLTGYKENPYKVLSQSKVMLITSRYEGTPMCALEAMSIGIPIVSVPVDGMKDVVVDGITGYLEDEDEELAQRLVELIEDENKRRSMSQASIKRFEEICDLDNYYETLQKCYLKELIN